MRSIDGATQLLIILGGLNLLLVGVFQFDFVATLLGGPAEVLTRLVYMAIGISAIWQTLRYSAFIAATITNGPTDDP